MKLTKAERLILIMLSEIHEKLNIDNGVDAKFVQEAIYSGHTWGLEWKFTGIVGDGEDETPEIVSEVVSILDMWSTIEFGFKGLSAEDKARVIAEAGLHSHPKFRGFDGNHEGEYLSTAQFLIEKLDRFCEFKGRDLNSHTIHSLDIYRQMYKVFEPMFKGVGRGATANELISVLKSTANEVSQRMTSR